MSRSKREIMAQTKEERAEYMKRYRAENKERLSENRKYYYKRHKEKEKAYYTKRKDDPEYKSRAKEIYQKWLKNNREHWNAYHREYRRRRKQL